MIDIGGASNDGGTTQPTKMIEPRSMRQPLSRGHAAADENIVFHHRAARCLVGQVALGQREQLGVGIEPLELGTDQAALADADVGAFGKRSPRGG